MVTSFVNSPVRSVSNQSPRSLTVTPTFDFCEFFQGHTRASGWFSDRFGRPRRHFCGDFFGTFENDKFTLDENLFYTDGAVEQRLWSISVSKSGVFEAESDSLIGKAHGSVSGNTLKMKYSMRVAIEEDRIWDLDMKDTMILQPDGSVHNLTHVFKWGVRLGSVSAQYLHHDGGNCCIVRHSDELQASEESP